MGKELTNKDSSIERQNILNNPYAMEEMSKATSLRGIPFEGKTVLLVSQIAKFFEVDERTIKNYLSEFNAELRSNGYEVLSGKRLETIKLSIKHCYAREINFPSIDKISQLGIFDFKAFLNLAMLLRESSRAAFLRKTILEIAISSITRRLGDSTKYINQRSSGFVLTLTENKKYRKAFTDTLDSCVDFGDLKYGMYTNKIYECIFCEKAAEYRRILRLSKKDNIRNTMYEEVLTIISSFESGISNEIQKESKRLGRKLSTFEVDSLFDNAIKTNNSFFAPIIENARRKMASRDLAFRDVLHEQLKGHIAPLDPIEFEKFLGETSKSLEDQMKEAKDVLKRLKEDPND